MMKEIIYYSMLYFFLFVLAIQDIRKKRLSLPTLLCFVCYAAVGVILNYGCCDKQDVLSVMINISPGVMILLFSLGRGRVGYADGIIVTCLGALLGAGAIVFVFFFSCAGMLLIYGIDRIVRGKRAATEYPFIPFLFVSIIVRQAL